MVAIFCMNPALDCATDQYDFSLHLVQCSSEVSVQTFVCETRVRNLHIRVGI